MNNRRLGAFYEEKAASFLREKGAVIYQQNYRNQKGEIDIIMKHDGYLVFVEVKYRKDARMGNPAEAVNYYKQKKICEVASIYRYQKRIPENTPVRYDVIGICGEEIVWYQNAFEHIL